MRLFTLANIITGFNLLSGVLSIILAFAGHLQWAVLALFLGALFDFFDGMTARFMKQQSSLGKELDSLADMVTFGVAPGIIVFILLILANTWEIVLEQGGTLQNFWIDPEGVMGNSIQFWVSIFLHDVFQSSSSEFPIQYYGWYKVTPFFALIIPFFSLFRLAKFNLDKRQSTGFIGLPTPANSIFFASFALILWDGFDAGNWKTALSMSLINTQIILPFVFLFSFFLIAEIPLFSLKFAHFKWKENEIRYIFLGCTLIIFTLLWVWSIPIIIFLYILLSIYNNKVLKKSK